MKYLVAALVCAAALPASVDAQRDVTRRAWTFLDNRLVVAVHAEAPGELQVIRGQRGRVEVAARSEFGFAGFGFGGDITRQLRLTAVGADAVQYLVVVPEHVVVRVQLPDGAAGTVSSRDGVATYRWGDSAFRGADTGDFAPDDLRPRDAEPSAMLPTTGTGLFVVHSGNRAPAVVDVPDLASIRSLAVRVQGDHFSIAASRPLALERGNADRVQVRVSGEPLDVVVFVPRGTSRFQLRSGAALADVTAGRPRALCGGAVVQAPTPNQDWLTLFPRDGRLECR
jgi:hypothetical protein